MKAGLQKSVRDAQIRDSYNKESFAIIVKDNIAQAVSELNALERNLPRNAAKYHTVLVCDTTGDNIFILTFEVLEPVHNGFRVQKCADSDRLQARSTAMTKAIESSQITDNEEEVCDND